MYEIKNNNRKNVIIRNKIIQNLFNKLIKCMK